MIVKSFNISRGDELTSEFISFNPAKSKPASDVFDG